MTDAGTVRPPRGWAFLLVALVVPLLLAALLTWLRVEYRATAQSREAVRASYQHRLLNIDLLSSLREAESAQRGYVLTGDGRYLTPYGPARRQVLVNMDALSRTADTPARRHSSATLAALSNRKLAEMDRTIAERRMGRGTSALAIVINDAGRQLMVATTDVALATVASEQRMIAHRLARDAADVRRTYVALLVSVLVVTLLLLVGLALLWRMRRARHAVLVAAQEASERNRAVLQSVHDALFIINPSGTIELVNPAAATMLGYPAADLTRRDIDTVVSITSGEGSFFQRLGVEQGQLRERLLFEREARHHDGRTIPVDVALSLMELPSGSHVIASLRDISERKRLDRLKDDLISTVSHELRTPLTSIVGALGLLRGRAAGVLPPDAVRLVEISDNNARRLIRLVNDMLDLDQLGVGSLQIDRTLIDLRSVAQRACEGSEGLGATRQVRIGCDLPPLSVMISGDADRLVQVLTNLLSNAVRVTPTGGVVRVGFDTRAGREVVVTVDDDGPGIPQGFRDRIFGRFERAENNEDSAGAGLGLAISRAIVDSHEGRIWFEDRPEGGTRFAVALPLRRPPEPLTRDGAARLLICAGDRATQERLADLVAADHYVVHCVGDTTAARAALDGQHFDALLLELRVSDESGLLLAQDLRRSDGSMTLPIIIVADAHRDDIAANGALDIVDWIAKPVDPSRLSAAVLMAVSRSGNQRPVILHLDDDPDILEVTAAVLRPDATVLNASTLPEARRLLESCMPDAAILDLKLADGSGLDLLPMLVDAQGLAVPTIIFSAQDVTRTAAARVDAVLVKSRKSLPDLRATIRRVMHSSRAGDDPR